MTPGPVRTALPAWLALALATAILTAGCGDRTESRPPPPVCGTFQVAEWDDDGWECEDDTNLNGVDDEEEEETEHARKTTRPTAPPSRRR